MGKALEWLGGSVLVYAVVAACSGGADRSEPLATEVDSGAGSGSGSGSGSGGMMGSGGTEPASDSGLADVVADALDAMVNPVPDADAQTPTVRAVTVPCATTIEWTNGQELKHAVVQVPGATPDQLAAIAHTVAGPGISYPLGFDRVATVGGFISGDRLAVVCSEGQTVIFYLPA